MVEIALRALFGPCSRFLSNQWDGAQDKLSKNEAIEENREAYIRGCFSFWKNVLERLCSGCTTQDSKEIFCMWLANYKKHLTEAAAEEESESEKKGMYFQGQVDAFNAYLAALTKLSNCGNIEYRKTLDEIAAKQKEMEDLYDKLEGFVWMTECSQEDTNVVSSLSK